MNRIRRQAIDWKKIFAKDISDKTIILIDTDNGIVVSREERGLEEYQEGKGGQIQGDRLDFG